MSDTDTRHLLGDFIRAHRERLSPPAKSLGRRRTPGWRREELAEAAGVGVTWITWLEQGRDVAASVAALDRLAQALKLSTAERSSLFDLAGKRDPVGISEPNFNLPKSILDLPSFFSVPAYLLDHAWTARAWNKAAAHLFAGWLDEASTEHNLLKFVFLYPAAQQLIAQWPDRARRIVAEFRADYSRRPNDPVMKMLIEELSAQSPLFLNYWKDQTVLHREGGARTFTHPELGTQYFEQTTMFVSSLPECKLVCLATI